MNLQDLASIGEFVGGLAVLVTLLYLALELRENTKTLKANSTTDSYLGWSEFNFQLSKHPGHVAIMRSFDPQESLDNFNPSEQVALDFFGRAMMQRFGAGSFQYDAGLLHSDAWDQQIAYCRSFIELPVWREWWENEKKQPIYADSFLSAIESTPIRSLTMGNLLRPSKV